MSALYRTILLCVAAWLVVRELGPQIGALFTQVLLTCDRQGLIGGHLFAIDGVKLPDDDTEEDAMERTDSTNIKLPFEEED